MQPLQHSVLCAASEVAVWYHDLFEPACKAAVPEACFHQNNFAGLYSTIEVPAEPTTVSVSATLITVPATVQAAMTVVALAYY